MEGHIFLRPIFYTLSYD